MSEMSKQSDETHTAFAIRCLRAEAWDEGFATAVRWNGAPMCRNPYRLTTNQPADARAEESR